MLVYHIITVIVSIILNGVMLFKIYSYSKGEQGDKISTRGKMALIKIFAIETLFSMIPVMNLLWVGVALDVLILEDGVEYYGSAPIFKRDK